MGEGDEDAWETKLNVRIDKKHACVCTSSGEGREASGQGQGQGDPLSPLILVALTTPRDLQTDYIGSACLPVCLGPPALPGLYVGDQSLRSPIVRVLRASGYLLRAYSPTSTPQSPGRRGLPLFYLSFPTQSSSQ